VDLEHCAASEQHHVWVPWLPMYLYETDVALVVERLDEDEEIAWLYRADAGSWKARIDHPPLAKRHVLWHVPSGPPPLVLARPNDAEDGWITDPWEGWQEPERAPGADLTIPYSPITRASTG
jgi:hypothetical protein